MKTEEFDAVAAAQIASKPAWFSSMEKPLDKSAIDRERRRLGFEIPGDYLHFVEHFGAGYCGSINISSLDSKSRWYRWDKPLQISDDQSLLILSDDEAGGYYGFLLEAGECSREIYYVNLDDRRQIEKVEETFFDFVLKSAFGFR